MTTRDQAWQILTEFTHNPSLIKHALAVEAAMRYYARHFGEDQELWAVVGLLHDFDYERFPNPPEHTQKGAEILRQRGIDEQIVGAMLSHAEWNLGQYPRDTRLRKTLFAADELCGFILAVAYVRPQKLVGMEVSSVKKKLKAKEFAAAVSREDIRSGAEQLGLPLEDHIQHCIKALQAAAPALGLA